MGEAAAPQFPRGTSLPSQSPLFWVHQKDRYLRQLLIADIEAVTDRDLVVYFTDCASSAQVEPSDDTYLSELLSAVKRERVDLLLETNGGYTDATEKFVSVLRGFTKDLRVIVPRRAKSNGTVIAFTGSEIVMGEQSELGPIDPNINIGPNNPVPAQIIIKAAATQAPIIVQAAQLAVSQTKKLATSVLASGMLKAEKREVIDQLVDKISSRDFYHSHGSVIDHREATALGIKVKYLPPSDVLWQRLWLLRTMYEHDCQAHQLSKLFESARISSGISVPAAPRP